MSAAESPGSTGGASSRSSSERERQAVAAALFVFLLGLAAAFFGATGGDGASAETCPHEPFYAPDELPLIHEINLQVDKELFSDMIDDQADRDRPEMRVNISFDGVLLEGAKIQVHGGLGAV